jgi:uncharacterized membrane protein (DUF4010 family)
MPGLDTPLGGAAVSLLIGLLIGLERERSQRPDEHLFAGIRTFPLLALSGYLGALASAHGAPLLLPAVLLAVAALAVAAYVRTAGAHVGATTEVAAVCTPLLGALVAWGEAPLAAALGVVVTLLLTLKGRLHALAGAVSETEIVAILKFGIVAVVLLPLLPTEAMGPYGAIVPRHVGYVVVIVSGVSLVGYLLVRVLGAGAGWTLAGLLGGLVSSTAVTLSFAGKARGTPGLAKPLGTGIVLASTVLYVRSLLLVWLFDAEIGRHLLPRLAPLFALGVAFAVVQLRGETRGERSHELALGNPAELGRAVALGLVFAAILVVARAAQAELGDQGLRVVSFVGGLADVDSVALALVRLKQQAATATAPAGDAVLLATLANLLLKGGLAVAVGGRPLAARTLPFFVTLALATLAVILVG